MKLTRPIFPKELDADVAMSVLIPNAESRAGEAIPCIYEFQGVSERTALGDNLRVDMKQRQNKTASIKFSLKRDSLYHILPEYLFHSLDHYLGLEGDSEEFDKRYKEQEEQKNKALIYFEPFDRHFQQLRISYQEWLNDNILSGNRFMSDFITDGFEVNLDNPYINAVYACIPWLRDYRGNDDMIATALGLAFRGKAEVKKERAEIDVPFTDNIHSNVEGTLDGLFCGPSFKRGTDVWKVYYHTEIGTEENLMLLRKHIEDFKEFFTTWFLSVETGMEIEFGDVCASPLLTDSKKTKGVFVDYSTQLI